MPIVQLIIVSPESMSGSASYLFSYCYFIILTLAVAYRPGKPLLSSKLGSGVNSANVSNTNSEAALMINATAIGSVNPVIGASSNADCKDVGGGDGDDYKPSRVNSLPTLIKTNSGSSLLNTARQQEMNNLGAIFSDT